MENKTVQLQNLKMFISNTGRNTRILVKQLAKTANILRTCF